MWWWWRRNRCRDNASRALLGPQPWWTRAPDPSLPTRIKPARGPWPAVRGQAVNLRAAFKSTPLVLPSASQPQGLIGTGTPAGPLSGPCKIRGAGQPQAGLVSQLGWTGDPVAGGTDRPACQCHSGSPPIPWVGSVPAGPCRVDRGYLDPAGQ